MTEQRDTVRDQYETYPYPARDPADEKKRLIVGSPSALHEIDHYIYGGRLDLTQPFRVLVAGGGTGDAAIMLAQQLADAGANDAEITYVDLSTASREIAEARARARKLTNIVFHTGSLLDAREYGQFDYIDCCGVLHHLPEPGQGFRALAGALRPGGGMGLMVYGTLGRSGVYDAQAMMRQVTGEGDSAAEKVALAKRLINALPPSNLLKRNPAIRDHLESDAGVYDLLLHSIDRSYLVPELAREIEDAGLKIASLVEPARYDPAFFLTDKPLLDRLSRMTMIERAAFAERLAGNMRKHIAYCVPAGRDGETVARPSGPGAVPYFRDAATRDQMRRMRPGARLVMRFDGLEMSRALPPLGAAMMQLFDGRRTLDDIRRALPGNLDWFRFKPQFDAVYRELNGMNLLFIRHPAS